MFRINFKIDLIGLVRIQDLCRGPKRDFTDVAQWRSGGGKKLGLKIGGRGGGVPGPPAPLLDPHLLVSPLTDCDDGSTRRFVFEAGSMFVYPDV